MSSLAASLSGQEVGLNLDFKNLGDENHDGLRHLYIDTHIFNAESAYLNSISTKLLNLINLTSKYQFKSASPGLNVKVTVVIDMSINANGSLRTISVRASSFFSNNGELEEAVMNAVKMSEPLPKFTESIAKKADVVHIRLVLNQL
jgi:hypothetical protein